MNYMNVLELNPLFSNISHDEILEVLGCIKFREETFQKNETILALGSIISEFGILVAGEALVIQEDYWGNRTIIAHLHAGDIFGESYACVPNVELEVSLMAGASSTIVFFNIGNLLKTCAHGCAHHHRIIQNLLTICARKNIFLTQKISHVTQRSLREKLLAYLSSECRKQNKDSISIPFNRQELADYLAVDRSALSSELSRMQKEGLIKYHKNTFQLIP